MPQRPKAMGRSENERSAQSETARRRGGRQLGSACRMRPGGAQGPPDPSPEALQLEKAFGLRQRWGRGLGKMRQLTFYGASDDLFEIRGSVGEEPDEVGCGDSPAIAKIEASDGSMCVVAHYAPADLLACWSIGISPAGEDAPIPSWPISCKLSDNGYSTEMTITVPDDAKVSIVEMLPSTRLRISR